MKLEELKAMVRESPNYRCALQRVKEAAMSGLTSVAVNRDKLNATIINRLEEDGYTVAYYADLKQYTISGW